MTWQRDESHASYKAHGIGQNPSGSGVKRPVRQATVTQVDIERPNREHEGYLIKELQQLLRTRIETRLRAKGLWLSFPHSTVLMMLNEEPGLSGAQLARRNSVTAQTMNGLLQPLEEKGLIERRADPENARILQCYLKPKGSLVLQEGMQEAATVFNQMLGKLSVRERDQFRKILQSCIAALQAGSTEPDAAPTGKRKSKS